MWRWGLSPTYKLPRMNLSATFFYLNQIFVRILSANACRRCEILLVLGVRFIYRSKIGATYGRKPKVIFIDLQ